MKYLLIALNSCLLLSISASWAQEAAERIQYNDDNFNRAERARVKAEHATNWIKTHKPSPPSEVNVYYMPETGAEKAGLKSITLRSVPKLESEFHSTIVIRPDGSSELSLFPSIGILGELTKNKATAIFGMPTTEGKDGEVSVCSYQLAGATGNGGTELEIYHLDCEFGNQDKLSKYRVRSSSLPKSAWISLQKK